MAEPTTPTLPSELPVLPLRRTVAFPLTLQPLAVNRPVSIETVHRALGGDRLVLLLLQDNDADDPTPDDLRRVGTAAVIRQMAKSSAGVNVIVEGVARVRADSITREGTSMRAQITPALEPHERTIEVDAHIRRIQDLIDDNLKRDPPPTWPDLGCLRDENALPLKISQFDLWALRPDGTLLCMEY